MYPVLMKIKERPGIYFGKPSITRLNIFLHGYNFARYEAGKPRSVDLSDFQVYIETIYNEKRTISWADIILENCGDEEKAFWEFYKLYEVFESGQKTVERFKEQYVNNLIFLDNKLIWNSLKQNISERVVTFAYDEGIKKVGKLVSKELFLYDERLNLIQELDRDKILEVIYSLEAWEEKDLYIFDVSMVWFIVFTHEDTVLGYEI